MKTILFIFLFQSMLIFAQPKYDFKQFGDETVDFIKQPGNWTGEDFLKLGIMSGITVGLMFADEPMKNIMLKDQSYYYHSIPMEFGRWWGEPLLTAAVGGLFLIHGIAAENGPNKRVGFEVLQSGLYSTAIVGLLKFSIGRARPFTNEGAFQYYPFKFGGTQFWSLPSGHTALAMSLSTILSSNVDSDFLKVIVYIPAFMTAFSRVYQNHHWLSDIFLGGAIGYFVAAYVNNVHNRKEAEYIKPVSSNVISINISL